MIDLDIKNVQFIVDINFDDFQEEIEKAHKKLNIIKKKDGSHLGWIDLPNNFPQLEIKKIKEKAKKLSTKVEYLVIIGAGGSYLGTKAVTKALNPFFSKSPKIFYAGNNLDSNYHGDLINFLKNKNFAINLISKSGSTIEPIIIFGLFKNILENYIGKKKAKEQIIITTDKKKNPLNNLAKKSEYQIFNIPSNIGGRYSVLTSVGLFPMAFLNIDIKQLLKGASSIYEKSQLLNLNTNKCYLYAMIRNILYRNGYKIELLSNYNFSLKYFGNWWKQLYAESEGKNKKGIFPSTSDFTTDLHSIGQWIQEGPNILFETILYVESNRHKISINNAFNNVDQFNFLNKKNNLEYFNKQAYKGTAIAHRDGGIPNMTLTIPALSPYYLGQLIYFFQKSCAISAYLLGVNPFDQPGVEKYKKNLFKLITQ